MGDLECKIHLSRDIEYLKSVKPSTAESIVRLSRLDRENEELYLKQGCKIGMPISFVLYGIYLTINGEKKLAVTFLEDAIQKFPYMSTLWLELIETYQGDGKVEEIQALLRKSLEYGHDWAFTMLAERERDPDAAKRWYAQDILTGYACVYTFDHDEESYQRGLENKKKYIHSLIHNKRDM